MKIRISAHPRRENNFRERCLCAVADAFRNFEAMFEQFLKFLFNDCAVSAQQRFLLAVSGGLDSVVLAHLFHSAGLNYGLAHMNFSLRGDESDKDEAFVHDLAKNLSIPFFSKKVDTNAYAGSNKRSIQESARELRYEWFSSLAVQEGFDYIVTGHHADDELETFFINLLRGTGIKGLSGYARKSGNLIRPLLFSGREEIRQYAEKHNLAWREDSSNASDKYIRNQIRHELLPLLYTIRSGARERLLQNIDRLNSEEALLNAFSQRPENEGMSDFSFDLPLLPEAAKPAFLMTVLDPLGFSYTIVKQMVAALGTNESKLFRSPTHEALLRGVHLNIRKRIEAIDATYKIESIMQTDALPLFLEMELIDRGELLTLDQGQDVALLDADSLQWPLLLRRKREGDRFHPLGSQGSKKLSEFLIDQKISLFDRDQLWLLVSDGQIVWVPGYRISKQFRVKKGTTRVLKISLKR